MARVLSENTYQRMMTSIGTTEGLAGPSRAPSVRRVRTGGTGAGSVRSYVVITTIIDAENYTGDVVVGPEDLTVTTANVSIKVVNATTNPYQIGYSAFSDVVENTYYIDGNLLG